MSTILDKSLGTLSQNPANFPSTLPGTNWTVASCKDEHCSHWDVLSRWWTNSTNSLLNYMRCFAWSVDAPSRGPWRPSCSTLQRGLLCDLIAVFSALHTGPLHVDENHGGTFLFRMMRWTCSFVYTKSIADFIDIFILWCFDVDLKCPLHPESFQIQST